MIFIWILRVVFIIAAIATFVLLGIKRNEYEIEFNFKKKCLLCIIPLLLLLGTFCVAFVPANNVGVKWSIFGGTSEKTLNEGMVFVTPFDKVYTIPTTVQERTIKDVTIQTRDAQFLTMEANIKFKVNKENAFNVYKSYETIDNLKDNIIGNYAQKCIEQVVTKYQIIEALGEKKNDIYDLATESLKAKLAEEGVDLVELTIKDMSASEAIEQAIEAEATASKNVETAKQNKEKAKIEAETKLIEAEGEAKANAAKRKELTGEIIAEQYINKWDGRLPYVSGSDNVMINISDILKGLTESESSKKK